MITTNTSTWTNHYGTYAVPNTSTIPAPGTFLTSNGGTGQFTWATPNPNLTVKGDAEFEGDIKLKGKSLNDVLEQIEERLAILRPNEELENRWEELRTLRNAYKELEAEIIEKEKAWDILKR
jgi:hypothetical protein